MSDAAAASVYLVTLWATVSSSFVLTAAASAMDSYKPVEIQRLGEGGSTEHQLEKLFHQRDAVNWSILVGRLMSNVAVVVCAAKLLTLKNPELIWLNLLFVTPIILVICEIFPRLLGAHFRHVMAGRAVWMVRTYMLLMSPIQLLLRNIFGVIAQLMGVPDEQEASGIVEEDLLGILDKGTETGAVDQKEIELIESVFELDDITVSRLMTPRPDIDALDIDTPWSEVLLACKSIEWSRIPIYEDRSDNIVGVLLVKDLLGVPLSEPKDSNRLRSLMLQPSFVPSSKTAEDMLAEFTNLKSHMAFVVDEHGTLTGLVTLDDLLEELVGELGHAEEEPEIRVIQEGVLLVKRRSIWMSSPSIWESQH